LADAAAAADILRDAPDFLHFAIAVFADIAAAPHCDFADSRQAADAATIADAYATPFFHGLRRRHSPAFRHIAAFSRSIFFAAELPLALRRFSLFSPPMPRCAADATLFRLSDAQCSASRRQRGAAAADARFRQPLFFDTLRFTPSAISTVSFTPMPRIDFRLIFSAASRSRFPPLPAFHHFRFRFA
jgi:hypothetical protein